MTDYSQSRRGQPELTAQELHDEELIDYIRETVVRLETLADRLEGYVQSDDKEDDEDAG